MITINLANLPQNKQNLINEIDSNVAKKADGNKEITQTIGVHIQTTTSENIKKTTQLTQRQTINQTDSQDSQELKELQEVLQGTNNLIQLSLNEILDLLGLKLSNVPGAGNCGPWAILHANEPQKRKNSGTYNKINEEITLCDVLNLRAKASEIAKKQGYSRSESIKKNQESMSTDDLIYYSAAINRAILCFNYYNGDVFITLHKTNLTENTLFYTKNKNIADNIIKTILTGFTQIKAKNFSVLKLQNLINKEFENPLMIYIGNGHFQSVLPK